MNCGPSSESPVFSGLSVAVGMEEVPVADVAEVGVVDVGVLLDVVVAGDSGEEWLLRMP
jgi:hypothetical protein